MNKYTIDGYGFTASGPEEDWVEIDGTRESICSLLSRAGVNDIHWGLVTAMELPNDQHWDRFRRHLEGAPNPPAYRIRITVEAERLTDEEAAAFWKRRKP